jgi:hypothetical protein
VFNPKLYKPDGTYQESHKGNEAYVSEMVKQIFDTLQKEKYTYDEITYMIVNNVVVEQCQRSLLEGINFR